MKGKCSYCKVEVVSESPVVVCWRCTARLVKYVEELEKKFGMNIKNRHDYIAARMMEKDGMI